MSWVRNISMVALAVIAWQYYQANYPKTKLAPRVDGYISHPAFQKLAEKFRSNVASGFERGAAFSVYHNGQVLVDIWGGWADIETERPWQRDTISLSFSMVKGIAALSVAKLVDMGLLDYRKEVSHYWPEFGTEDKKKITVEMLLSHQAGLIGLGEKISPSDYRNKWEKIEKLLASEVPAWPPGTAVGYHGFTFGMYADALVRKVDPQHRNISQFFHDEIATPLGIDFDIGLPLEKYHRFARVQAAKLLELRTNFIAMKEMFTNQYMQKMMVVDFEVHQSNNPDVLSVGIPSVFGVGSARGLAKLYDFLANGGSVNGNHFLSSKLVADMSEPFTKDLPNVAFILRPMSRGLLVDKLEQGFDVVGHPGAGGNMAYADMTNGLGVAYTTNFLAGYLYNDPREVSLRDTFYECFKEFKAQESVQQRAS